MTTTSDILGCEEARARLVDRRRGRLDAAANAALERHLAGCSACRGEDAADARLEERLRRELPAPPLPAPLAARLAAMAEGAPTTAARALATAPPPRRGVLARVAPVLAVAAALAVAIPAYYEAHVVPARLARAEVDRLGGEAVNDHLRVLSGEAPLAIVSSGIHEVKPWFAGKLDFAPVVGFAGDDDFPLAGGTVASFLDRKAATIVYKRRLHTITLFVLRADGLTWPAPPTTARRVRGFQLFVWRAGELGYALVSDLEVSELRTVAARLGAPL